MGDSILEKPFSSYSKMAAWNVYEQYHNASFPVGIEIQYARMLLFLDSFQIFCEQLYFRLFK